MERPVSDSDLISRLGEGDSSALYTLYDRYSAALYGVIIRICKKEDLAQDLLQETFVKIWQKIDQYDEGRGKFYTWSYRIAKNLSLNALRKESNFIHSEDLSVYKDKTMEEEVPHDFSQLTGVLNTLEPHHRRALTLVYFNGLTHREAHTEMEVPLGTFKSYIRQALKQVRDKYGDLGLVLLTAIAFIQHG